MFDGGSHPALEGSCAQIGQLNELNVYGQIISGGVLYSLDVVFPDSVAPSGTYKAVFSPSATLQPGQCRATLQLLSPQTQMPINELRASNNMDIILVNTGNSKFKVSFNNIDFGIVAGGGTAKRKVSASPFGCE